MWLWWIFIQICPSTPFSLCMHDDIFGTMPSRAERRTNQPINQPKRVKFAEPYIHNIHRNFCVCLKKWHFNEYDEKLKRFSMLWCILAGAIIRLNIQLLYGSIWGLGIFHVPISFSHNRPDLKIDEANREFVENSVYTIQWKQPNQCVLANNTHSGAEYIDSFWWYLYHVANHD